MEQESRHSDNHSSSYQNHNQWSSKPQIVTHHHKLTKKNHNKSSKILNLLPCIKNIPSNIYFSISCISERKQQGVHLQDSVQWMPSPATTTPTTAINCDPGSSRPSSKLAVLMMEKSHGPRCQIRPATGAKEIDVTNNGRREQKNKTKRSRHLVYCRKMRKTEENNDMHAIWC